MKFPSRFFLPFGLALALSACDVFKPDNPNPNDPGSTAANPYDTNAPVNNQGGYPPYGGQQPGPYGGQPTNPYGTAPNPYSTTPNPNPNPSGTGGYTQPNYTPGPYTQPADPNPSPYTTPGGNPGGAGGRSHVVASGESLSRIAQRYGTTTDALMRANNITNPNYVRAGQTLTIP